jgi:hypothetical protein
MLLWYVVFQCVVRWYVVLCYMIWAFPVSISIYSWPRYYCYGKMGFIFCRVWAKLSKPSTILPSHFSLNHRECLLCSGGISKLTLLLGRHAQKEERRCFMWLCNVSYPSVILSDCSHSIPRVFPCLLCRMCMQEPPLVHLWSQHRAMWFAHFACPDELKLQNGTLRLFIVVILFCMTVFPSPAITYS